MVTNKTNIQAQINTIADGVLNPASTVRNVFGTDPDSLLEAVYSETLSDDSTTETYTTANANFSYVIDIYKVGSNITITGRFTALATTTAGTIFTITDLDLESETTTPSYRIAQSAIGTTDTMPLILSNSILSTNDSILSGEAFTFTINYKSKI